MTKYRYSRKQILELWERDLPFPCIFDLFVKAPVEKKCKCPCHKHEGELCWSCSELHPSAPKVEEKECTLEPYCKCEDCQNYEGGLPIDRV